MKIKLSLTHKWHLKQLTMKDFGAEEGDSEPEHGSTYQSTTVLTELS